MRIIPLSEGTFTVDKTKFFIPFEKGKDDLQSLPSGSLLVEIQPFLVVTAKDVLLFDTGLGFSGKNNKMQIYQNLLNAGIGPSEVTKVLLSHLHKDHAGSISDNVDHQKLSFPDATYYLQERELKMALEKGQPSFATHALTALQNSSKVILLKNDSGTIDDYIHYQVTAAHSPFHQIFLIREDEIIFFGGDDAPQLQQMKHRFVAKYDFNGEKTMQLRRKWREQGEKENWTFLFYHDVKNPVWKF